MISSQILLSCHISELDRSFYKCFKTIFLPDLESNSKDNSYFLDKKSLLLLLSFLGMFYPVFKEKSNPFGSDYDVLRFLID